MRVYVYPADNTGCGFYRMMAPARALRMQGHDVTVVMPSGRNGDVGLTGGLDEHGQLIQVNVPQDADVMVFQRVTMGQLAQAVPLIRAQGVAVVVDMDDDLTCIDPRNIAWTAMHPRMGRPGHTWDNATRACMDATLVTVSTPALLATYAPHGRGVVLENCVPADYLGIPHEDSDVLGWPGSVHSHPGDPGMVGSAVSRLVREGHRFMVVGDGAGARSAFTLEAEPETTGLVEFDDWPRAVTRLGVGIAPLVDTKFNRGKCVDSGMRIATDRGVLPAGELKAGMAVWRDRWCRIQAVEHGAVRPGVLVTTTSGYQLKLTPEHRMLVNGDWMEAGRIAVGDEMAMAPEAGSDHGYVSIPWPADGRMSRRLDVDYSAYLAATDGPRIDITPRWGRFLGAFAGDGCAGQSTALTISCDGQDQDWIDMLSDDLRSFGLHPQTQARKTYGGEVLRRRSVGTSSAHLLRVLADMGVTRPRPNGRPMRVPCVPEVIWRSPREVVAEFLAGYFEADGTADGRGGTTVSACSKDEHLIRDVQRLLLLFGIESTVRSRPGHAQTGSVGTYWYVSLRRAAVDVFAKEIGFRSARKQARVEAIAAKPHSNAYRPMQWTQQVVSVEPCTVDPIDIQVDGSVFMAAGFVSHNSWLKPLELAAVGVPWVASPRAEYVRLHRLGCGVLADKPSRWYRLLRDLAANPAMRDELSAAGREVASRWTVEGNAWRWAQVWEDAFKVQRQAAVVAR